MTNPLRDEIETSFPRVDLELPTRGQFYAPDVLANGGTVQVGILSLIDEQKYRDPFLLVSGHGVYDMVRHICPDVLRPDQLCEVDVEAILVAARLASYGPTLKLKHICQNTEQVEKEAATDTKPAVMGLCAHDNSIELNLQEFIFRYAPFEADAKYEITLPRVGQTVFLQPVPYRTSVTLMKYMMSKNRQLNEIAAEKVEEFVERPESFDRYAEILDVSSRTSIEAIVDCIVSVRTRSGKDVFDRALISDWITALPVEDTRLISQRVNDLTTQLRDLSKVEYECESCAFKNAFYVQMNPEILFLADAEDSKTPEKSSASSGTSRKISKPRLKA